MTAEDGRCAEPGCERPATYRVHVPWEADRSTCAAHARARAAQDGVVAVPLDDENESD